MEKENLLYHISETLANILNLSLGERMGERARPISPKALSYYANPKFCKNRYSTFKISKKSGGERLINAPVPGLNFILGVLNHTLNKSVEPHPKAFGFVPKKSIVDNAYQHINKNYVYNIDLKDFFHSFDRKRVKGALKYEFPAINLKNEKGLDLPFFIAALCTHPFKIDGEVINVLPQGSPTSPMLSNLLCKALDRRLSGLANRFGLNYSRYADDITFSSNHNVYNKPEFLEELARIIELDQKLKINPKKTRLQKRGYTQEVTGLRVNEKPNVRRMYIKQIRNWIYLWERYGYDKAQEKFIGDYLRDKGHSKKGKPNLVNVLSGKLEFLKMVKGSTDSTYKKLHSRFKKLEPNAELVEYVTETSAPETSVIINEKGEIDFISTGVVEEKEVMVKKNHNPRIEKILKTWEQKGLEAAAKLINGKSNG